MVCCEFRSSEEEIRKMLNEKNSQKFGENRKSLSSRIILERSRRQKIISAKSRRANWREKFSATMSTTFSHAKPSKLCLHEKLLAILRSRKILMMRKFVEHFWVYRKMKNSRNLLNLWISTWKFARYAMFSLEFRLRRRRWSENSSSDDNSQTSCQILSRDMNEQLEHVAKLLASNETYHAEAKTSSLNWLSAGISGKRSELTAIY